MAGRGNFRSMAEGVKWTRQHRLIAMNLYMKIPFGQLHARNPSIIAIAEKMGRSANSLAMKLCNFASMDPVLQSRGIKGLTGAANEDHTIWKEFSSSPVELKVISEDLLQELFLIDDQEVEVLPEEGILAVRNSDLKTFTGPTEGESLVTVRRGQQFFRQVVLNAYGRRCCISGLSVNALLRASHIIPWSHSTESRLLSENGLCLSVMHDAAFDNGLIAFDSDSRLLISKKIRDHYTNPVAEGSFKRFEGMKLENKFGDVLPRPDFLRYHREKFFKE